MQPKPTARLLRALQNTGRRRIPLELLRKEFAAACPELAEQPDRRTHLADALQAAASAGDILLPRRSQSWDKTGGAALPGFVTLATPRLPRVSAVTPGYAWHPLLSFAAGERNRLRLEAAKRINEWLKSDPDLTLVVPIKERSLEIFGDEKRLDQLRTGTGRLLGHLTLADLACRICPIPLPFEPGPATSVRRPVLIIENNDTWASFSAWNRATGYFSAVAYAGGGHAKGLGYDETFIDELLGRFQAGALYYFGDIDPAGLRIANGAARRRATRRGVPLQPAVSFYMWLLEHGCRTALRRGEQPNTDDLAWLPNKIRSAVEALFVAGQRIPQEALGTQVLATGNITANEPHTIQGLPI
jgi:hypothetical protein